MVRTRTGLSESWGVMDQEDTNISDFEGEPEAEVAPEPRTRKNKGKPREMPAFPPEIPSPVTPQPSRPRKRVSRTTTAEPELVMPSPETHTSPLGTSRMDSSSRSTSRPSSRRTTPTVVGRRPKSRPQTVQEPAFSIVDNLLYPVFSYIFAIIGGALRLLAPVMSYALVGLIIVGSIVFARNLFISTVQSSVAPLCNIPGASYIIPFCASYSPPNGPVEFDQLMNVQAAFEDVIAYSNDGASLPADMKRSETVIRDLRGLVQNSALPSRNELEFEMGNFITESGLASRDLQRFNAKVAGAVDRILGINAHTLNVLGSISKARDSESRVGRFLSNSVLFIPTPRELLVKQYLKHTSEIEDQIANLILLAQALLGILDNLEERLDTVHNIATRDGVATAEHQSEVLAHLWTKLGGNRATMAKLNVKMDLLNKVAAYRRSARSHVAATVIKLQQIAAGLEDLRERVAAPEVLGLGDQDGGVEMHIVSIERGIERLLDQSGQHAKLSGESLERVMRALEHGETATVAMGKDRMIDATRQTRMPMTAY